MTVELRQGCLHPGSRGDRAAHVKTDESMRGACHADAANRVQKAKREENLSSESTPAAPAARQKSDHEKIEMGDVMSFDETTSPQDDIVIEICNSCGGLVGWENIRGGCCPGGVVCKREKGVRSMVVTEMIEGSERPYLGTFDPDFYAKRFGS